MDYNSLIEQYLFRPYWIVDVLPKQVSANSKGQYFNVERFFLTSPQVEDLCMRFARLLLKINCYEDISVGFPSGEWTTNPEPATLVEWVGQRKPLFVVMETSDAMIAISGDDAYLTLYNPSDQFLAFVHQLAASEGLFVWQP